MHQRKMFDTITPVNFNTIATPHIGLIRFPSIWSRTASVLGPKLLSRTGEQFYSVDKWSAKGRPLLEVMADPGTLRRIDTRWYFHLSTKNRTDILPSSFLVSEYPNIRQCVSNLLFNAFNLIDFFVDLVSTTSLYPI